MVLSWLAGRIIGFLMGRTRAGDIRPTLALDGNGAISLEARAPEAG